MRRSPDSWRGATLAPRVGGRTVSCRSHRVTRPCPERTGAPVRAVVGGIRGSERWFRAPERTRSGARNHSGADGLLHVQGEQQLAGELVGTADELARLAVQ